MRASHSTMAAARDRTANASMAALVAAGVLWGTGGPLGSLLGRFAGLSVLAVAAYRLLVGGATITIILAAGRRGLPRGLPAWRRITVIGLLSALYQSSYFAAIALTSVSMATLVTVGATPALVVLVEACTGRQRLSGRVVLTVGLAVAGLGLLTGIPAGRLSTIHLLAGTGLSLISAAGFAAVTLLGARPVAGLGELTMTGTGFLLGGAVLAPFAAIFGGLGFPATPAAAGLLIVFGIAPTAAAYLLYFRALRRVSPATASVLSLLEPLTSTLLAVLFLGDHLNAADLAGAALLTAALLLAGGAERGRGHTRGWLPTTPVARENRRCRRRADRPPSRLPGPRQHPGTYGRNRR
jgi:drug/metabolite transporter, DME family